MLWHSEYTDQINFLKIPFLLGLYPLTKNRERVVDMTGMIVRKRLSAFWGLQILFAALITLIALAFIIAGSARGDAKMHGNTHDTGKIVTKMVAFHPDQISVSDYND